MDLKNWKFWVKFMLIILPAIHQLLNDCDDDDPPAEKTAAAPSK